MKTYLELLDHCKNAKDWKYVYGTKGKKTTKTQILALQKQYGKSYVWDSDLDKAGSVCCDCSGLISSCTGILRSSTEYKNTALETVSIAELKANWNKYIGWGIWLQGHIGVVSDKEGYYYALDGSNRDWVHYPLSKNSWKYVIKLKDIDYTKKETKKAKETHDNSLKNGYPHYRGYVQGIGWCKVCGEGGTAGTTGERRRMEALKIDYPGVEIKAKAHIQKKGDIDYGVINSNTVIGSVGGNLRLEALEFTGPIQFRVHIQNYGWTNWVACDKGASLGTRGKALRIEAIEIKRL